MPGRPPVRAPVLGPALALATVAVAAMIGGCSLLISFDEVPSLPEGGAVGPLTTGADVGVDAPSPPDSGIGIDGDAGTDAADADAARDANANPDACKGNPDGKYCGGDQITWPGSKDDLITCAKGVVSGVRLCNAGVGCIRMLNGYPDQCDECPTKADGTYCGRDMPGWDPLNVNFRVRCQNHAEVGLLLCLAPGCGSNAAASACK